MTPPEEVGSWPDGGIERALNCPLCDSTARKLVHSALQDRIFFTAPGVWDLWQCEACGTGWLDPRPNAATIGLAYGRYYTHAVATADPPQSALARFRAKLGNGYRNSRFGTRLAPAFPLGRIAAILLPGVKSQIDLSYRYLPNPHGRKLRLLDIGCGNGAFLQSARDAGWLTFGVEPDPVASRLAQAVGHEVRPHISDWNGSDETFDAITMSHVIEHVHNPTLDLTRAFALLRGGGHLFVDTPNIDAVGHRLYGRHWRGLEPPRHLVLFNRNGLHRAIGDAGFARIRFRPRRDALPFTARQSRLISDGADPYSDAEPFSEQPWPDRSDTKRAILGVHSEFLTVTAEKPR
jgi:SAM-dependent methyltransferase